eukprot:260262-Prymnesium_polylepis.1
MHVQHERGPHQVRQPHARSQRLAALGAAVRRCYRQCHARPTQVRLTCSAPAKQKKQAASR